MNHFEGGKKKNSAARKNIHPLVCLPCKSKWWVTASAENEADLQMPNGGVPASVHQAAGVMGEGGEAFTCADAHTQTRCKVLTL